MGFMGKVGGGIVCVNVVKVVWVVIFVNVEIFCSWGLKVVCCSKCVVFCVFNVFVIGLSEVISNSCVNIV